MTSQLPAWVRKDGFQPHYTNIHSLLQDRRLTTKQRRENGRRLYGTETMEGFNDWDASVLLLAKDANPMQTFLRRIEEGDPQPWRHGQPWEKGGATNTRLQGLAAELQGTKLYGSAMVGLLRNDGQLRGPLPDFQNPKLQAYLRRILLEVVFPRMKNLRVIICLGKEACEVIGNVVGSSQLALNFHALPHVAKPVEFEGKQIFAAWHPIASKANARLVWVAAARALKKLQHNERRSATPANSAEVS